MRLGAAFAKHPFGTSRHLRSTPAGRLLRRQEAPQEKEMIQRKVGSTDQAIDFLVYQLYGLTEAEIKIVEGG